MLKNQNPQNKVPIFTNENLENHPIDLVKILEKKESGRAWP